MILFISFSFDASSQDGPGGVQNTSGSSNLILWLSASELSQYYSGNNVSIWYDLSGYDNNVIQNSSASKPNLINNFVNGNPAIRFNGSTEYFGGSLGGSFTAPGSIVSVFYFNNLNQPINNNDYVVSIGTNDAAGGYMSAARRSDDGSNINKFYSIENLSNLHFGPVLAGQQWSSSSQIFSSSGTLQQAYINGSNAILDSDYTTALNTDGTISIGNWADAPSTSSQFLMDGYIAEVMVFNHALTDPERKIIHAYLGAKYDITFANDVYSGDDFANGDHDANVIGIGFESGISHDYSYAKGIHLNLNSNFENGDYVMAGHATAINSINTSDITGASLQGRWERAWWIDKTDAVNVLTVDLTFDYSDAQLGGSPAGATNYKLIYRNGLSGAWTDLGIVPTISGDRIIFSDIDLPGDGQYTLGTIDLVNSPLGLTPIGVNCDGPGGIGSTAGGSVLHLWLDANRISGSTDDQIVNWPDISGNQLNATGNPSSLPKLATSIVNQMNAISFDVADGSQDYLSGTMGNLDAPATIIAVPYFDQANQGDLDTDNDYVFSLGTTGVANQHASISRRLSGADVNKYYSFDGAAVRLGPVIPGQTWEIFTQLYNSSAPHHQLFIDGTAQTVDDFSAALNTDGTFQIGRWNGGAQYLLGDISEIIAFNKSLNDAELNIVHSYLSAKYDIPVAGDKYAGDDALNLDFDFEVAGVGMEASGSNDSGCSGGLILSINSNFENGDYVLAGHTLAPNYKISTDINSNIGALEGRWERIWFIDVTDAGSPLTVDLTFDFSSAGIYAFPGLPINYKLLYRSTNSPGLWIVKATASLVLGDQVTFSNVSLTNDGYYALGSIDLDNSPLPVELTLFNSKLVDDYTSRIFWETASELNTEFFEVEKAINNLEFSPIGRLDAQGNSTTLTKYELLDPKAVGKNIYYRLRMVDRDGTYHYSNTIVLHNEQDQEFQISVFPNPVHDEITIVSQDESLKEIYIYDNLGQLHTSTKIQTPTKNVLIDLSQLNSGFYVLQIRSNLNTKTVRLFKD